MDIMLPHKDLKDPQGTILQIIRMSTEDGPGIRTSVFMKGCPLECIWCHNPEAISPQPQIQWIESRCIGCETCLGVCPEGALSATDKGILIDRGLCKGCGACAEECPSTALEILGQSWTVNKLVREIMKDRAYFEKSDGGITVTGGEPTTQTHFVATFLKECHEKGLHTALDTCGQCRNESLCTILPYSDLVLFDLKECDPKRHKTYTGVSNRTILENLLYVRDFIEEYGKPTQLWIRTPIIPDTTARDENVKDIGKFIARNLSSVVGRWELCSFNNLCRDKYTRLGMDWAFKDCNLVKNETMEHFAGVAKKSGVDPDVVHWSGSTSIEEDETPQKEDGPKPRLVGGRAEHLTG